MKEKPEIFNYLAYLYIVIAISIPLQIMMMYRIWPQNIFEVSGKISPSNMLIMITAAIGAALLYAVVKPIVYVVPAFLLITAWNNYLIASYNTNYNPSVLIGSWVLLSFFHVFLLTPESRNAIANSSLRWWKTPARRRIRVPSKLKPVNGSEISGSTHDLSETGVFVPIDPHSPLHQQIRKLKEIRIGQSVSLRLSLDQLKILNCRGEVVRKQLASGHHPAGVGIRFVAMNSKDRKMLQAYLNQGAYLNQSA